MKKIYNTEKVLFDALTDLYPDSSNNTLRSLLKLGRVTINGRICKDPKKMMGAGDEVEIWPKIMPVKNDVQLLYEDANLCVINKPAGLLSVAANYEEALAAHTFLKDYYRPGRVFVVHRIDREVSGLMLFARTEAGLMALKKILEERKIEREYAAIVEGEIKEAKGKWESHLIEDDEYFVRSTKNPSQGEHAVTHYQVVKQTPTMTQLNVKLETGRKNQIRVHCSEAGHPIVGDKKYGAKTNPVHRLCLHSFRLKFKHPLTEKLLEFETPLPEEFFLCFEKNEE
jgi:tRNA pseudouridine32 synthase/23S rRNA pseudouridine746 synthase/23S rRNA pseudouridine1911/1915/1917 synthase